jgi:hypothetical protein
MSWLWHVGMDALGIAPVRLAKAGALSTTTRAVRLSIGVGNVERMSVKAVGLADIPTSDTIATSQVLADGDRFQMGRVTTPAVSTKMVNVEPRPDLTVRQLPRHTMSVGHWLPPTATMDLSVALVERREPRPAFVWAADIYLRPEPLS